MTTAFILMLIVAGHVPMPAPEASFATHDQCESAGQQWVAGFVKRHSGEPKPAFFCPAIQMPSRH